MFFELSKTANRDRFERFINLPNGLILSTDLGWQEYTIKDKHIVYKGYHAESFDQTDLFHQMLEDTTPRFKGNFYMFISDNNQTVLTHNADRSSYLIHKPNLISNLHLELEHKVPSNHLLSVDKNFNVEKNKFPTFSKEYPSYTLDQALDRVDTIILDTYENFLKHNTKPLKIFISGGIDTLMAYAYLDHLTKNYEIVDYEYHKFTYFYKKNWHDRVNRFWGYRQSHTWGDQPTVLVTGAMGDEYFMRSPTTTNMMLMHYGINVFDLFKDKEDCYHYTTYMKTEPNVQKFQKQLKDEQLKKLTSNETVIKTHILNQHENDHQFWHIDETTFFTPFKNLEIPKIILGLPKDVFLQQVLDAQFGKKIVERLDPNKLKLLSKQKNSTPPGQFIQNKTNTGGPAFFKDEDIFQSLR